jgi:hypothetical protein
VHSDPFPKLEAVAIAEAKFHKRFRSKAAYLAHVAVQTRPDVLEHAARAARRLNNPVPECEKYVDEVLQFYFLGSLPTHGTSDAALADTLPTHGQQQVG